MESFSDQFCCSFVANLKGKGKGKDLDTCYSAAYMSQARDQQRFTISEVTLFLNFKFYIAAIWQIKLYILQYLCAKNYQNKI